MNACLTDELGGVQGFVGFRTGTVRVRPANTAPIPTNTIPAKGMGTNHNRITMVFIITCGVIHTCSLLHTYCILEYNTWIINMIAPVTGSIEDSSDA
jgi:hypothetical protein